MTYIIQRETRVLIEYQGSYLELDAAGSYSLSQTFTKTASARKTLHSKAAKPLGIIQAKAAGSLSLQAYGTDSQIEGVFFKLLGMDESFESYLLPDSLELEPIYFNIFIILADGKVTQIKKCVLTTLSYYCTAKDMLNFSLEVAFSDIDNNATLLPGSRTLQGALSSESDYVSVEMDGVELFGVQDASISFQQQISWRSDKSLHEAGKVHVPTLAYITGMATNIVITTYTNSSARLAEVTKNTTLNISYGNIQTIIKNAIVTTRDATAEVFTTQLDVTLQEHSSVEVYYGAPK